MCAPWSAYVDPSYEDIWKEQHLSMQLWANLCTDCVVLEYHLSESEQGIWNLGLTRQTAKTAENAQNFVLGCRSFKELITMAVRHYSTAT